MSRFISEAWHRMGRKAVHHSHPERDAWCGLEWGTGILGYPTGYVECRTCKRLMAEADGG